ncbi:MAG: DUF1848 domain-containing protein [Eubacteriales bacterium]|nr:DUF1848 domain-containing protein [Eubacteriales bacterium]
MIIQTGQRTDIPAFYSEWFCNRIKAGEVLVRNPFNPQQITKYSLNPDVVDVLGFCTKNPEPMLKHMDLLKPYRMYWFVTITPYGREIEPNVPPKEQVMESFKKLSEIVGTDRVSWRYDPIFLNETYTIERHIHDFKQMAETLAGYTKVCVISFIDLYEKVKRNFPEVRSLTKEERLMLGKELIQIAGNYDMLIRPCAEGTELSVYGADCRGCMTKEIYEQAAGTHLNFPNKKGARENCACYLSGDIGQYNTCGHLCRYCYANVNAENVHRNMKMHDPKSPLLIGHVMPGDKIHVAEAKSWANRQMSIFDLYD